MGHILRAAPGRRGGTPGPLHANPARPEGERKGEGALERLIYKNPPTAAWLGGRSRVLSPPPAAAATGKASWPPSRPKASLLLSRRSPSPGGGFPASRRRLPAGRGTGPSGMLPSLAGGGAEGAGSESLCPSTWHRGAGASDRCSPLVSEAGRSGRDQRAALTTTRRATEQSRAAPASPRPSPLGAGARRELRGGYGGIILCPKKGEEGKRRRTAALGICSKTPVAGPAGSEDHAV